MRHSFLFVSALILGMCLNPGGICADPLYGNFYVKASATGANDGSSWTDAFTNLQDAIDLAEMGDLICVAAGTYLPTFLHTGSAPRNATYYINKDITILGGFAGEPGTEGDPDRDPKIHVTILSGDLGVLGDLADNAFHIVYFDHVSDTCRLDGFTISQGSGLDGGGLDAIGNAIFNNGQAGRSNPTIVQCIIRDNINSESAAGMWNDASSGGTANPIIRDCVFLNNRAGAGGAIACLADSDGNTSPLIINCQFIGNTAKTAQGGAISIIAHSAKSSPRLINCLFRGNHSPTSAAVQAFMTGTGESKPEFINCTFSGNSGGSVRISDIGSAQSSKIIARNSIFYGNGLGSGISGGNNDPDLKFCITEIFSFPGEGNIALDPAFVNQPAIPFDTAHDQGDLHLTKDSPAIDVGSNDAVPVGTTTDLDGKPRFVNATNGQTGIVDMGPYEFEGNTTAVKDFLSFSDLNVFPNPAQDEITITLPEIKGKGDLRILDEQGRVVSRYPFGNGQSQFSLHVAALPSGIYFIHLQNGSGQDVKKVIIE